METLQVADLNPHDKNPRQITAEAEAWLKNSMKKYGDLGGVTFNLKTRKLVTGHQRVKAFDRSKALIEYDKKSLLNVDRKVVDPQGTVMTGWLLEDGCKFNYREVRWDEATERAAMIVANTHAGTWADHLLRENLELAAEDGLSNEELNLPSDFTAKLFKDSAGESVSVQGLEQQSLTTPMSAQEIKLLPSQTQMVQLFMTVATRPKFLEVVGKLKLKFGFKDITSTVEAAVYAYALGHGVVASSDKKVEENVASINPFD